jgi:hypothetical protein
VLEILELVTKTIENEIRVKIDEWLKIIIRFILFLFPLYFIYYNRR